MRKMKLHHPTIVRRLATQEQIHATFDRLVVAWLNNHAEEALEICEGCPFEEKCGQTSDQHDLYCKTFIKNANQIMDKFDTWVKEHPEEDPRNYTDDDDSYNEWVEKVDAAEEKFKERCADLGIHDLDSWKSPASDTDAIITDDKEF